MTARQGLFKSLWAPAIGGYRRCRAQVGAESVSGSRGTKLLGGNANWSTSIIGRQVKDHGDAIGTDDEIADAGCKVRRVFNS